MRRFKFKWNVAKEGVEAVVSIVSLDFQDQGTFLVSKSENVLALTKYGNHAHIPFMTETEMCIVKATCEGYYAAVTKEDNFLWIEETSDISVRLRNTETANQALKMQLRAAKQEIVNLKANKTVTNVKHIKSKGGYEKLKKYSINEVLPYIGSGRKLFVGLIDGVEIHANTSSVRLQTFKKNLTCVDCGIKATHFWVECNPGCFNYHLNLYGINKAGDEVLMTKDHIIPKSKNGKETLDNMQTMCTRCNNKKGNTIR